MHAQSYLPCIRRSCYYLGALVLALLLEVPVTLAQPPGEHNLVGYETIAPVAAAPVPEAGSVVLSVVGAAGLFVAGRLRARRRQKRTSAPLPNFEAAFRRQQAPRVRVDKMPVWRHEGLPLRRSASRLGFDQ